MPVSDLNQLIQSMDPVLHEGVYVFSSVERREDLGEINVVASIEEAEGISVVLHEADATSLGLEVLFRAAWITLTVHSDLEAIGLTAAFSDALAKAGISCNVVAGAYHDHIFVPVENANRAMQVLEAMQD